MVVPATVDALRPVAVATGAGSPTGIGFACAQALAPTRALSQSRSRR
jgi:3-oxoacyl-[acyl-carrier protein] reductase